MRSYILGESAEQLEQYRVADETAEQKAAGDSMRLRTYHLFQSTPLLKEIATIEAGAKPSCAPVIPDVEPMLLPAEGASRTACRLEPSAMPVRIAPIPVGGTLPSRSNYPTGESGPPEETFPLLYWPGIRTPQKPFSVLDERLDVLPFGFIKWHGHSSRAGSPCHVFHPNWCLTIFTWQKTATPSTDVERRSSRIAPMPEGHANWALGCAVYVSKRFPFKEFKYAADRDAWLSAHRNIASQWNALKPPHELTDGQGLRPGVEPWIRHAESDPFYVHWIAIDLGEVRPVDEVVIAHDPAWVAAGYRIEAGLLAEATENRDAISCHRFACRRTRWVRILYTHPAPVGLSINRIVLWEIEVRGPSISL
jgi:hypothetical protein